MRPISLLLIMMATFTNLTACSLLRMESVKEPAGGRVLHKAWPKSLNVASTKLVLSERAQIDDPVAYRPHRRLTFKPGVFHAEPPENWPTQRSWKPRSFYGPWFAGSHFDAIQIVLRDKTDVVGGQPITPEPESNWYYTNYFHDITGTDLLVYKQYIPAIPADPTTTSMPEPPFFSRVPGQLPKQQVGVGLTDVYLSLNEIHLSSLYGGSVELVFRSHENVEVEVRKGDTLWDLGTLEARIFVTPTAGQMNPLAPQPPQSATPAFEPLKVELKAIDATEYSVSFTIATLRMPIRRVVQRQANVIVPVLTQALDDRATTIEGDYGFRLAASQFAHAWLHVQHQALIDRTASPREGVDAIEISDDFFDMDSSVREAWFSWWVQVVHLNAPQHLTHLFEISSKHYYDGTTIPVDGPNSMEKVKPGEVSRWIRVSHFDLARCDSLDQVNVQISVRDRQPNALLPALRQVWNDGLLSPESESQGGTVAEAALDVDCDDLDAENRARGPNDPRVVSPNVVLLVEDKADITLLDSDFYNHGSYRLKVKLLLVYR